MLISFTPLAFTLIALLTFLLGYAAAITYVMFLHKIVK